MIINKYKIVIIACYFGKLPQNIDLWIKSCAYNKDIDFILFTDQNLDNIYSNIKIINTTLDYIEKLARKNVYKGSNIKRAYKLCDFKPSYGHIFKEYITEYDFWGYCDIDLIFGDIRAFITDDILDKYTKILYLGHLSLYKNDEKSNQYYKLNGTGYSYEEVFSKDISFGFDEDTGIYQNIKNNGIEVYDKCIFADITPNYRRFRLSNTINKRMNKENSHNYKYQIFFWKEGKIYRRSFDSDIKNEEYVYIHFQKRKFMYYDVNLEHGIIIIGPNGFKSKKNDDIGKSDVDIYNKYNGMIEEILEDIKRNISIRLSNVKYKIKYMRGKNIENKI